MILSGFALETFLRERIELAVPTAVVRFGDGEGRLLGARPGHQKSIATAMRQIVRQTGTGLPPTSVLDVSAALQYAHQEADVLGSLTHTTTQQTEPLSQIERCITHLRAERLNGSNPPVAVASCLLNHELLPRLPDLLKGLRISVITCRDVRSIMEERWGARDITTYQIPSNHSTRAVDNAFEVAMHDVPIWPDAHHRICSELVVRERGEVVLVGAGVFGKDLCILVRERGGIGLDMGVVLDYVAGRIGRNAHRWVLGLIEEGLTIPEIGDRIEAGTGKRIDDNSIRGFVEMIERYVHNTSNP